MEKDYFDIKNEYFYDFLNDLFNIKKAKTWDDIAKNITIEKITRTYKTFAEIFPRNYDYISELKKSKNTFSSIHYGDLKARKIINEVVRFSLYSEKIFIFHPLQNPSITNQKIDPRKNPKYWLPDFLDALYFYIVIQKWVKSGIVKLIINPYEYDFELRDKMDLEVEKRIAKFDKEKHFDIGKKHALENIAEQFSLIYKNKSKDYIVDSLLGMSQPRFTEYDANEFSEVIIKGFDNINPLYNKLNIPLNERMLAPTKGGGPLEPILSISEITNGNIYTPSEMNWIQIREYGLNDFWLKTNRIYSKISLNFLNNVDTNFALELRKDDRLSGVRQQLKKVYSELNGITPENLTDLRIKDLNESFTEEVKKAEAEWKDIKKQAESFRKYWLVANVGVPLIKNDISLLPLAIGSLAWLYNNEKSNQQKKNLMRQKNPISVFVDLKNQNQNFFSIFKNCLI
ncbi:hypothetical protein CMT37_12825 [Elizabethkingia anophelis]|nr:hypothetical protein [Elizabethkingia anophelis]